LFDSECQFKSLTLFSAFIGTLKLVGWTQDFLAAIKRNVFKLHSLNLAKKYGITTKMSPNKGVVLIVGGESGFGLEVTKLVLKAGFVVHIQGNTRIDA
jgi:hypothetical protein